MGAHTRSLAVQFLRQCRGASAAEFALVIPVMMVLTLGTINAGVMGYAYVSLHYATQTAARCGAIDSTNCGTTSATQTYAASKYVGPNIYPTFTATLTASCSSVTGSGTYHFVTGVVSIPVSMSATACYPLSP